MAVHASHALPYPIRGARFSYMIAYYDADGDPTDPVTPDTEVSKDNGTFADAAEEVVVATGGRGNALHTLSGAETDASTVGVWAGVASGPKAPVYHLYPRILPILHSGTATAGAAGSITLAAGAPAFDLAGCYVRTTGGTGGGGTGGANNQARMMVSYNPTTKVGIVSPNWEVTVASGTTYDVLYSELAVNAPTGRFTRPTVDGRATNVTAAGTVGINWADIENPTTAVALTNTTLGLIANAVTAAVIATGAIDADAIAANALAAIKAQIVAALTTDTYAEPGTGAPPTTADLATKVNYLYKVTINDLFADDDEIRIFNSNGVTVGQKHVHAKTLSTYTRGKMISG